MALGSWLAFRSVSQSVRQAGRQAGSQLAVRMCTYINVYTHLGIIFHYITRHK